MKPRKMLLLITAITTGLIAGLFFAWACSVIPGLSRVTDTEYIAAMQSINRAILNPLFFSCFMGALLLLPVCTIMQFNQAVSMRFWLLLAASAVYLTGVFGVTILGNVPLNNMLDTFSLTDASSDAVHLMQAKFEIPWNKLNSIRTVSSIIAFILVLIACLNGKE